MEYTATRPAIQPPNPNTSSSSSSSHTGPHYSSYYPPQNPNPNPVSQLQNGTHYSDPALNPPGVDPYSYAQPGAVVYPQPQAVQYSYYPDPNAVAFAHNWAVQRYQYAPGVTIPPNGTEQLVPRMQSSAMWPNPKTQPPQAKNTWKRAPKKTKIVQFVYCEVCKIDCNTKDVLDQHKLGKKHKKNLEKLKVALALAPPPPVPVPVPVPAPVTLAKPDSNLLIGPQENPSKGISASSKRSKKKKGAESAEDLEMKRRKVLEGGAAVEAVRTCSVCNVVCNSETVFRYHLAGAKHIALVKKLGPGTAMATAT